MWWMLLNTTQISFLIAGLSVFPHYTATFGFLFDLIILGKVRGTDVYIDFVSALVICLAFLVVWLAFRTEKIEGSFKLIDQYSSDTGAMLSAHK